MGRDETPKKMRKTLAGRLALTTTERQALMPYATRAPVTTFDKVHPEKKKTNTKCLRDTNKNYY